VGQGVVDVKALVPLAGAVVAFVFRRRVVALLCQRVSAFADCTKDCPAEGAWENVPYLCS
jgi:hypothetical protein